MSQGDEALCPLDHTNLTKLPTLVVLILTGDYFNPDALYLRATQAKLERANSSQRQQLHSERSRAQEAAERAKEMIKVVDYTDRPHYKLLELYVFAAEDLFSFTKMWGGGFWF